MVSSSSTSLTKSTVSLVLLLGLGLPITTTTVESANAILPSFSYHIERPYETTSLNAIANNFSPVSPRDEALRLFGVQSNFTPDEKETYRAMLKKKSQKTGKNIFDLFE